jgi:Mg2+ and Co2+ transporter CorA
VYLPKRLVTLLVQDLVTADSDREQLQLCEDLTDQQAAALEVSESLRAKLEAKIKAKDGHIATLEELTDEQEQSIMKLNKQLNKKTKAKRLWTTVAITAVLGAIFNHLSWKYL